MSRRLGAMRRGFLAALALLALLVFVPVAGHATTRPAGVCPSGDTVVTVADFSFTPSDLPITAGTTVCWTYPTGHKGHTVTADDGSFLGNLALGQIYEHTFSTNGDHPYHCFFHQSQGMVGTVHVTGGPPPPPPPPPPSPPPPPPPPSPPPPPPPFTPPKCHVPNVVGQKLAGAKLKIRKRHCRVGKITKKHSSLVKKGRVLSQNPKPGRTLRNGAKVRLTVGKGPGQ